MKSLDKPAGYYGLSLILGGAESSLWDVTKSYASAASTLNYFVSHSSTYRSNEFSEPSYLINQETDFGEEQFDAPVFGAGAIYHTFKSLREVNRPEGDENWQFFDAAQPIAWKTGTSFGFKDAWAVGVTPKYAIGVWAGNADGEGRPGLVGISAAAPILFDVLATLPHSGWFQEPYDDLAALETCTKSGQRASIFCGDTQVRQLPANGFKSATCPYHHQIFLDAQETYRVNAACYPLEDIVQKSWFKLPPVVEYYYSGKNPDYKSLPPFLNGCSGEETALMEFIHPRRNEEIILPKDFGRETQDVVFKLAHQRPESAIFWYLDDRYIGSTKDLHELIIPIKKGDYVLTAMDDEGHSIKQSIHIQTAGEP